MALKSFNNGSNNFSNANILPVLAFSAATNVTKNLELFTWTTSKHKQSTKLLNSLMLTQVLKMIFNLDVFTSINLLFLNTN